MEVADVMVGDSTTLFGLADAVRPVGGVSDNETLPENPFMPLRVITKVPEDPAAIEMEGLTEMMKSRTLTRTRTEWEIEPLVPVTFTLNVPEIGALTVNTAETDPPAVRVRV